MGLANWIRCTRKWRPELYGTLLPINVHRHDLASMPRSWNIVHLSSQDLKLRQGSKLTT